MPTDDFQRFLRSTLPSMGYRWRRFDRRNIRRRVSGRMESLRIFDLDRYARLVAADPVERSVLDSLLRLTITRFFRNAWLWEKIGQLLCDTENYLGGDDTLDIWSAGCAGGEECFSLAMVLDDLAGSGRFRHGWTILGTDTDPASLERSRGAAYSWGSVREVPEKLRARWFREENGLWTMADGIRRQVHIRQHDLLAGDPPGRYHTVFMRNSVLTYNTEEVGREVLEKIRGCLLAPGYLVIGRTETMPGGTGFEEVGRCVYRKSE